MCRACFGPSPPRFMLRQDHGAEQAKRDRSRTKGKTLSGKPANFREGVVECGGSRGIGQTRQSERQSSIQVGDSREFGILAIPHLGRTRLVQRGHNLWTIRAWPSVASEFLPAPTVCLPPRHPIEESSKEQNIRVPYRQLRGLEALACLCESGIERFRPRAEAPDVCRLSA